MLENAEELGIDPGRVAVGGDSAGGTLAAVVARRVPIEFQLLICPVLDHRFDTDSYECFAEDYFLTRDAMRWYWAQYLGGDDGTTPDASLLRASRFAGLPPAVILVAGCDPLRDEGLAYAAAIQEADVPVTGAPVQRNDPRLHPLRGERRPCRRGARRRRGVPRLALLLAGLLAVGSGGTRALLHALLEPPLLPVGGLWHGALFLHRVEVGAPLVA